MKAVEIRPFKDGEEKIVAKAHETLYLQEYDWGPQLGDYAKQVVLDFAKHPRNDREELWVAVMNDKVVGSITLAQTEDPKVGQLRLFYVDKAYRGHGIGHALTEALMEKAKRVGYDKLILWSANSLTAARKQ